MLCAGTGDIRAGHNITEGNQMTTERATILLMIDERASAQFLLEACLQRNM
jgi:hypothetical protein